MKITVIVPDRLEKSLRLAAADRNRTIPSLVVEAIDEYLKRENRRVAARRVLGQISGNRVADDALEQLRRMRDEQRDSMP